MTSRFISRSALTLSAGIALVGLLAATGRPAFAQDDREEAVPSAAIGIAVPEEYLGPAPSDAQKELIGPFKLLKAGKVDQKNLTIQLPLYEGKLKDGRKVWYIVTDTDDRANAEALGLNFSAKLTYGAVGKGARTATLQTDGTLVFDKGTVDFKPERKITPGDAPTFFPPKVAEPGSLGDADYSPLVRVTNAGGHVYNAPIVAFNVDAKDITFPSGNVDHSKVHDKVVKIDPEGGTVTLKLTPGFSFARPVLYLSFDSSDKLAATLEESTLAPGLSDIRVAKDDSVFSATERIFVFRNGPTGKDNPQRQGLDSALSDGPTTGGPLNVLGGIPTVATDYSPLWDLQLGEWTPTAISKGYRSRLNGEFDILRFVKQGHITGPGGAKFGSVGIIVNCPIVMRLL